MCDLVDGNFPSLEGIDGAPVEDGDIGTGSSWDADSEASSIDEELTGGVDVDRASDFADISDGSSGFNDFSDTDEWESSDDDDEEDVGCAGEIGDGYQGCTKRIKLYSNDAPTRLLGGSSREGRDQRTSTTQAGVSYGGGKLLPNNLLQPECSSLEPVHIVPPNYGWRKAPTRKADTKGFEDFEPEDIKISPSEPPVDIFLSLFDRSFHVWLKNTNQKGEELASSRILKGEKPRWSPLTVGDGLAFIAVLFWMDRDPKPRLADYWSRNSRHSCPFVREVSAKCRMSCRRFVSIIKCTRLYDAEVAERSGWLDRQSPHYDTQAKVRPFLDALNESFQDHRKPGSRIAIDEAMTLFKGRWQHRQCVPTKPTPNGAKSYVLCTAKDGYVLRTLLHTNQTLPYSKEMGYFFAVVWCLLRGLVGPNLISYLNERRVLYTDRLYTSVTLFYALAKVETFAVGTVKMDKKNLPKLGQINGKCMTHKSNMQRGAAIRRHDTEDVMSFVSWKDSKSVNMLSTHPTLRDGMGVCSRAVPGVGKVTIGRPDVVEDFSQYMGAVDQSDQNMASTKRHIKTYVWTTCFLYRGARLCANNVFAMKKRIGGHVRMVDLKENLAEALLARAAPMFPERPTPAHTIPYGQKESLMTPGQLHTPLLVERNRRRRCCECKKANCLLRCMQCDVPVHGAECWEKAHLKRLNGIGP